jgi:hypothetical protein
MENFVFDQENNYKEQNLLGVMIIVFNTTFNNISVLLVEETGVPRENRRPQVADKLFHIMMYQLNTPEWGSNLLR